ncbi:hypothetical protein JL720_13891 [Aureococcus anophagefferens]|nr:hypothetical protein JL720_13891 [Aureococcus anophagefferens]
MKKCPFPLTASSNVEDARKRQSHRHRALRRDDDARSQVHDVRSQRMVEAWQPGGFMRLWWDALSEQEQLDHMQGARDGRDAWWAALSEQEQLDHALRFPNQQPDFVPRYATAEARLEANCARANERYAKIRAAQAAGVLQVLRGRGRVSSRTSGSCRRSRTARGTRRPRRSRAANVVTAGFEPGKSPFPRVYDLECELYTPKATKDRKERLAKSSAGA